MTAYQAGIAEFEKTGAAVIGVSTDNLPSLRHWAQEVLKLSFPLASDFARREVARAYGVLNEQSGIANRTTFVIGPDGKILHIDEGSAALDPEGALTVCRRTKRQ